MIQLLGFDIRNTMYNQARLQGVYQHSVNNPRFYVTLCET